MLSTVVLSNENQTCRGWEAPTSTGGGGCHCMERYRYLKKLSGADVARIFEKYDIYGYITKYFEALHTMGDNYIVQDIDDYIANAVNINQIKV